MKGQPRQERPIVRSVLIGVIVSIGIMLIAAGILSVTIESGRLAESAINYGILVILMLSSVAGSTVSTRIAGTRRLLTGVTTAIIYFVCLLACTALFFEGMYKGVGVTALVLLAGGVVPVLLSVNGREKRRTGHKIRMNR